MARDIIHEAVRAALENDNWVITDDPLKIDLEEKEKYFEIDLGAEKVIAAEKGNEKIAVEIKSFASHSLLYEFHEALGQYLNYRSAMSDIGLKREMVLAISTEVHNRMKKISFIKRRFEEFEVKILIVDIENKTIVKWIR